jgi:hypothetical protein
MSDIIETPNILSTIFYEHGIPSMYAALVEESVFPTRTSLSEDICGGCMPQSKMKIVNIHSPVMFGV